MVKSKGDDAIFSKRIFLMLIVVLILSFFGVRRFGPLGPFHATREENERRVNVITTDLECWKLQENGKGAW